MQLNHLNLCAGDVPGLSDVFTRHFGFALMQAGQVPAEASQAPLPPGSHFAILRGTDGFSLILTEPSPGSPRGYPDDFHLGFTLEAPEQVVRKHEELHEAGLQPDAINHLTPWA